MYKKTENQISENIGEVVIISREEEKSQKRPKVAFCCLGIIVIAICAILFSKSALKSFASNEPCFSVASASQAKACPSNLFAEPVINVIKESPDMALTQNNSVLAISSPLTINPQVLASVVEDEESAPRSEGGIIEYIVEAGDTVASIATKFNISENTIMWANGLSSKTLKPGQNLVILPVSGLLYLVKDGDTVGSIATKYKAKGDEIIAFNNLTSETDLYIGDMIVIPNGKKPENAPAPSRHIANIPMAESYFILPCEGTISQRLHGPLLNGVDIANSCGKPIVAAAGGKVQRASWIAVGGNSVTILHPNGVVTYYGHLSVISVKPGQVVSAGDIVGYMGKTGYATGCHLHFETRGAANFMSKYSLKSFVSWK